LGIGWASTYCRHGGNGDAVPSRGFKRAHRKGLIPYINFDTGDNYWPADSGKPEKPGEQKVWNNLKKVFVETEDKPWQRGDAMVAVIELGWKPKDLVDVICSWSEHFAVEKTQHYDCLNAATDFPREVRLDDDLPFTTHSDVLRGIKKLKKKQWLTGWDEPENRKKVLATVVEKKAEAKTNGRNFGRKEILAVVANSECCVEEYRGKLTEKSEKPVDHVAELQKLLDKAHAAVGQLREEHRNKVDVGRLALCEGQLAKMTQQVHDHRADLEGGKLDNAE
jgi:hypothetical protein